MKILRSIFYLVAALTLCEMIEIQSLYLQNSDICISSDWTEPPMEEDENEDGDDLYNAPHTSLAAQVISNPAAAPLLRIDLSEPFYPIVVPPPQG